MARLFLTGATVVSFKDEEGCSEIHAYLWSNRMVTLEQISDLRSLKKYKQEAVFYEFILHL